MYAVRERLLRIYEEAAGEPYQSDVTELRTKDAGIKQQDAEFIESLRIVSQLRINEVRKALEERDSMVRKNPSNNQIVFRSQEIREKIQGLRENAKQFRDMEKKCEKEMNSGSAEDRAVAQQNYKDCRDMASLIDEYCNAFTEEERERAFQRPDMCAPGMPSVPAFGGAVTKPTKLDELLPVHKNAEDFRTELGNLQKEGNEDLEILAKVVYQVRVKANQVADKLGEVEETIATVDEKVAHSAEDIKDLHISTAAVRKKVASVGKCIWIAIVIILLAIVAIWLYRIIARFS